MLKVLRENIKYLSWILWVIIILFVAFVFVDFGAGVRQRGTQRAAAATVGSDTVSLADFQRQYRRMETQYRQQLGAQFTPELVKQLRLPITVLDQMVTQKILLREAGRLGLQASDAEVRDHILADPSFKDEQGRFLGDAIYKRVLEDNGMTAETYEQQVRDQVVLQKLIDTLRANLWISDQEVEKAYRDQVERAKIRYVQLPGNRFAPTAELPQSEVAAYFASHKEEYRLPEQREVAYLLVETARLLSQVTADEAALRGYYEAHRQEFAQEEQVRARHILVMVNDKQTEEAARAKIAAAKRRLDAGEDFAKVAGEVSEDPGSKGRGGDLGFFGRNRMVKPFEDAAFAAEPGKLVGPIRSDFGFHLLKVEEKHPAGQRPYEEVRADIANRLAGERVQSLAETKAKEIADRLAKDAPRGPEALQAIATQDKTVTYALSGRFGQQDPVPGIGPNPAFTAAAFALEKGKVSAPVQVPRGWAILYLKDVYPPHVPELAEVEPRIRFALAQEREQKAAVDRLAAAKGEIAAGKTLDEVAKGLALEVKETPEFGGQGAIPGLGYNPQLIKAAMALPQGQIGGPIADPRGAILFQVTERKSWDPQQFRTARAETRNRIEQEKLGRLLASLLDQRRRELGVQYDRQLLDSFGLNDAAGGPGQPGQPS